MRVVFLDETDSTNAEALRRWFQARPDDHRPFAVVAETQSSGRGREDRKWESPRGGLWFSAAWPLTRPQVDYQAAPLIAGATLAKVLHEMYDIHALVKWPNDIHCDGRKLAGILCQIQNPARGGVLIVGIGVNGNYPAAALGRELRFPATTLMEQTGAPVNLHDLAHKLGEGLESALGHFEHDGLAPWLHFLNDHLAWKGERVTCDSTGIQETVEGRIEGIDEEGRLLLLVNGRIHRIRQGEISRLARV